MRPRFVEVEGTNYAMGLQYGKKLGKAIRGSLAANYSITEFYTGLSREKCAKNVGRFTDHLEMSVPHLCEEMRGIADGSKVSYEDILTLNFHARDLPGGCTMVYVDGSAAEDGRALTGQTVDWTPMLRPYYHLIRMSPNKGPEMLQFTQAGVVGLIGRNSAGVNVFMNILLTSERIRTGLPAYVLLRLALEQRSLEDALTVLKEKKRASPFNYLISEDGEGACNVEGTPTRLVKDRVTKSFYVHTNHCLDATLKKVDTYVQVARSDETLRRYSRMNRLLEDHRRTRASVSDAFRLLSDHENFPDSICRHGRDELKEQARFATLGAVMSREGDDGLWVSYGNPCDEKPNFYSLD